MCAAMYVHTHMCAMHASVHDCFQAHICCYVSRAKYTSGGAEREGVCILKSFCPHAHPQLHSASFLLTCVVYFPTVKYLPAALGNQPTSQQIVSTHKSKYYHFFGWHDGIQSHRVCSV